MSGFNIFTILETEKISKVVNYEISYMVFLQDYPENIEELRSAFTVTIVDPCDAPLGLSPLFNPVDQEYTITEGAIEY